MSVADSTIKEQLKAALRDPGFLDLVSGAVAARVSGWLLEELASKGETLLLLLSLDAHNHVDDYSGTLGRVRRNDKKVLKLLHCLKFLREKQN